MLITAIVLSATVSAIVMWMGRKQGRNGKLAWLSADEMGLSRGFKQNYPDKLYTKIGHLPPRVEIE